MGSRGRDTGFKGRQKTISEEIKKHEISNIIKDNVIRRQQIIEAGESVGPLSPSPLKKCVCCGEYTIPVDSEYAMCPVCGWIDDEFQNIHPDSMEGKNSISLSQAKSRYNSH